VQYYIYDQVIVHAEVVHSSALIPALQAWELPALVVRQYLQILMFVVSFFQVFGRFPIHKLEAYIAHPFSLKMSPLSP